jgi:colicin import membrane protein
MKKAYLLAPLLALLAFGVGYWHFTAQREQELAALKAQADAAHQAALQQEAAENEQAVQAALAAQTKRKQELADTAARDQADQAARQSALAARDQARDEQARLTREADQLRRDLAVELAALAALESEQTAALDEQAYLQRFNLQAAANARDLEAVLKKLATSASSVSTPADLSAKTTAKEAPK